jgi:hypothetical protein
MSDPKKQDNGLGNLGVYGEGNFQVFEFSGHFKVPKNIKYRVRVFGAGGGGALSAGRATNSGGGGGGAGGGFALAEKLLISGSIISVTVGKGGGVGADGGLSSFGIHVMAFGGEAGQIGTPGNDNNGGLGGAGGNGVGGDFNFTGGKGGNGGKAPSLSTAYVNGQAHNELPSSAGAGGGAATQVGSGGEGADGVDTLNIVPVSLSEQGVVGSGGGGIRGKGGVGKIDVLLGGLGGSLFGDTQYMTQTIADTVTGNFDQRFISACFFPAQSLFGGKGGHRTIVSTHIAGDGQNGSIFCGGGSGASGSHQSTGKGSISGNGGLAAGGGGASGYDNDYSYSPIIPSEAGYGGDGLVIVEW